MSQQTQNDEARGAGSASHREDRLRWQQLWPELIARVWRDESRTLGPRLCQNPKHVLAEVMDLRVPDGLNLKIEMVERNATGTYPAFGVELDALFGSGELTLYIPPPPTPADARIMTLAATSRNAHTLPFTCCC